MAIPARYRLLENDDRRLLESGDYRLLEGAYDPYEGYDVFPFGTNWATPPSETLQRSMTTLDNQTGLHTVRSHTVSPIGSFDMVVTLTSRSEIAAFRSYLRNFKGRTVPIWVPTWQSDFKPTANFSGSSIVVESVGYQGTLYPHNARKHLAIISHQGTIFSRGVTNAVDNGTTETLTLSSAIGETIYANACLISFLLLCRLDADLVSIVWNASDIAEAKLKFTEIPREAPSP
jgi:hypothetical protein